MRGGGSDQINGVCMLRLVVLVCVVFSTLAPETSKKLLLFPTARFFSWLSRVRALVLMGDGGGAIPTTRFRFDGKEGRGELEVRLDLMRYGQGGK